MTDEDKSNDESLIEQQIEYYRARAAEYDEWVFRRGRYDRGEEHRAQWLAELGEVHQALDNSNPGGHILELACGTGIWTERLAKHAIGMTAVDVSSEMLEINRTRVNDSRVEYIKADLFSWQPAESFDYIFFGFWLSHVPLSYFEKFWSMIQRALKPNGKVFFIDSRFTQESTARNHAPLEQSGQAVRKLNDGREFSIVKLFYEPDVLAKKLSELGWNAEIKTTDLFFIYGCVGIIEI
jgi:ubiquinone/menaquinone biosynthesis C-methylase UbiE